MSHRASVRIIVAFAVVSAAVVLLLPPIRQDAAYHAFADGRTLFAIPNALNVLSNLPFLVVGALGLRSLFARGRPPTARWEGWAFTTLFVGVALVGFGSAYYHLAPGDDRLVWDRLPMAMVFMAVLAVVVAQWISAPLGARLFVPLVLAGIASVLVWRETGDLRPYVLVQFLPLLLVPLILLLFPARGAGRGKVAIGAGIYGLAKALELLDHPIYTWGHLVSGHTLKHLVAAVAIYTVADVLDRRRDGLQRG